MSPELKAEIVRLFLAGESVNHIAFLLDHWFLDHSYRVDDVNEVIRERLRLAIAAGAALLDGGKA